MCQGYDIVVAVVYSEVLTVLPLQLFLVCLYIFLSHCLMGNRGANSHGLVKKEKYFLLFTFLLLLFQKYSLVEQL